MVPNELRIAFGLGDQPSDLARPGWLHLASTGSIWLPLAPLLGRSGLEWLDLAAPGFLAGSIWLLCALLGAPTGSIWLPNECPIDTISKNRSTCLSTILLRCCLLRALWNVSSCLKSSRIIY